MPKKGTTPALHECDKALSGPDESFPYGITKTYILARREAGLSVQAIYNDLYRDVMQTGGVPPAKISVERWVREWEGNPVKRRSYPKKEKIGNVD